jgi:hypothetical protein
MQIPHENFDLKRWNRFSEDFLRQLPYFPLDKQMPVSTESATMAASPTPFPDKVEQPHLLRHNDTSSVIGPASSINTKR